MADRKQSGLPALGADGGLVKAKSRRRKNKIEEEWFSVLQ